MPAAGIGALTLRTRAHAMTVGLPILPAAAVGPTVVKVESAPVNLRTISGGTGRARLRRTHATCLWQLGAPRHPVRCPGRLLAGVRLLLHISQLPQALSFVITLSPSRLLLLQLFDTLVSLVFVVIVIVVVIVLARQQHLHAPVCSILRHLLFRRRCNLLRRPRRRLLTSASTGSLQ